MTDDPTTIDDLASEISATQRRESLAAEAAEEFDDHGNAKFRPHDPRGKRFDDLGNPRPNPRVDAETAAEMVEARAREVAAEAVSTASSKAGTGSEDIDPRIAEAAESEGW